MANSVSKIIFELLTQDKTRSGVDSADRNINKLRDSAKLVKAEFADMTRHFAEATAGLSLLVPLVKGVGAASALRQELNGATAQLKTQARTAQELTGWLDQMEASASRIGDATGFSKTQIVGLQKELIKAGAGVADVVSQTGAAAAAATLGKLEGMDPTEAGKTLVGIGTPFKVQANDYLKLADSILRASDASSTGVAQIAEAAKYSAGPLASLGRSYQDTFAMIATLSQSGIEGSMAGTSLNAFFKQASKIKAFQDANGNLKATSDILAILRKQMKGMGDAEKANFLNKLFRDEGARAGLALLREGKNSYADMAESMRQALPVQEKLNLSMSDFNTQLQRIKSNSGSLFATLFKPAEKSLAPVMGGIGSGISWLGDKANDHPAAGMTASLLASLLAAGGLAYGSYKISKGLGAGGRMMAGLKSIGSEAMGIAKGKAVEAATGVTPVYITNWPSGMAAGAGGAGSIGGIADAASAAKNLPKALKSARAGWALLRAAPSLGAIGELGAGAVASSAGLVGAAGLAGYGFGSLIYKSIENTDFADRLGGTIAQILSPFSKEAEAALSREGNAAVNLGGTLKIQIDSSGRARVAGMRQDQPGVIDYDVYTGPVFAH